MKFKYIYLRNAIHQIKLWSILGFVACGLMQPTFAQSHNHLYPQKPIHIVMPFPPGGSADLVGRIIAKQMSEKLGQAFIIDNLAGADGAIAAKKVANASPDGYTLFMATYGSMSAINGLHKNVDYDSLKDFTPIGTVGEFSMFLFAHPSLGVHQLADLIEYEHKHSGQLNYASGNVASIVLSAELVKQTKMNMQHIPYKGEVPAMNDFVAGRIQLMFATPANTLPFVKEGKLNAIAAVSSKRSPLLPQIPTWSELGMKNIPITPWAGLYGPAQLPEAVTKILADTLQEVLALESVQSELLNLGFEAYSSTPEEFDRFGKNQKKAWLVEMQSAGIQAQ